MQSSMLTPSRLQADRKLKQRRLEQADTLRQELSAADSKLLDEMLSNMEELVTQPDVLADALLQHKSSILLYRYPHASLDQTQLQTHWKGYSALHLAAARGNVQCVDQLLYAKIDVNLALCVGDTFSAQRYNLAAGAQMPLAPLLHGEVANFTPLHAAIHGADPHSIVSALLESKADVQQQIPVS